ncbi:MAG: DUF3566 domain-containing protein [Anaerolineae bacterium]|nr:DUF3566 domain-containing protein [Anaerolineae bacterium]
MVTVKRIGVNSAFKVGAMIGLITSIISGLLFVGLQALFYSAFASLMTSSVTSNVDLSSLNAMTAFGVAGLCIFFVVSVVFSAIAGGIGGVILAFAYNLAARWVGGLEVELDEEPGKRKRAASFDDIYE